jgi:hypothetical protein
MLTAPSACQMHHLKPESLETGCLGLMKPSHRPTQDASLSCPIWMFLEMSDKKIGPEHLVLAEFLPRKVGLLTVLYREMRIFSRVLSEVVAACPAPITLQHSTFPDACHVGVGHVIAKA